MPHSIASQEHLLLVFKFKFAFYLHTDALSLLQDEEAFYTNMIDQVLTQALGTSHNAAILCNAIQSFHCQYVEILILTCYENTFQAFLPMKTNENFEIISF